MSSSSTESIGGKLEDNEFEGSKSVPDGSGKLSKASKSYSRPLFLAGRLLAVPLLPLLLTTRGLDGPGSQ